MKKSYTAFAKNNYTGEYNIITSKYESMDAFISDLYANDYSNIKVWTTAYWNKLQENGGQRRSYTPKWKKEMEKQLEENLKKELGL